MTKRIHFGNVKADQVYPVDGSEKATSVTVGLQLSHEARQKLIADLTASLSYPGSVDLTANRGTLWVSVSAR